MHSKRRVPGSVSLSVTAIVMVTSLLAGCGSGSPAGAAGGSSGQPNPTGATTQSQSARAAAVPANILHVCDHVQDAFRSGSLDDAAQNRALAAELQGMIDVADADAAQMLRPMAEAAAAIGADNRPQARPRLQKAQTRAYEALRDTCVSAGSQVWN